MHRAHEGCQSPNRHVDLSLCGVALVWGATFVLVKAALQNVSTLLFLTLRFSLAAIALALITRKHLDRKTLRRNVAGGCLAGVCLFSGYVLQTFGLRFTTAGKAGFLTGLYIPLVPAIGMFVYKRPPAPSELLGIGAASGGMALMSLQPGLLRIDPGDLLVIGCAFAYAVHILVLGHFAAQGNVAALTLVQIFTGSLAGAATFWWVEPVYMHLNSTVWIAVLVTGILATAVAFSIQTWAQARTTPTRTALIFSTEPVFALLVSWIWTGEVLTARSFTGALLIIAGILLVELKPLRWGAGQ